MREELRFTKVREVKTPVHEHQDDAGIDFFLPEITEDFHKSYGELNMMPLTYSFQDTNSFRESLEFDEDFTPSYWMNLEKTELCIPPNSLHRVPTGIKMNIPPGTALIAKEKSGLVSTSPIGIAGGVVDAGYEGEIVVFVVNKHREKSLCLKAGEKFVQFLLIPVLTPQAHLQEVTLDELYPNSSSRGEGGFGSTGS